MRQFIYSFRAILIAAAIIGVTELSCRLLAPPQPLAASNFLELAYLKKENPSKIALLSRTQWTISLRPDIAQVGDSSGLHGAMPTVIDTYLGGLSYVNDGFAGDIGYIGHYSMAKALVDSSPSIKAIVLYVTPMAKPAFYENAGRVLEQSLYSSFVSPWHYLAPPSLGYRIGTTNLLYYMDLNNEVPHGVTGFLGDTNWRQSFFDTKGFIPRESAFHVRDPLPLGACPFAHWFEQTDEGVLPFDFFYSGLEDLALLAREKHVRLMVVFNPVPCHEDRDVRTLTIERELARFRQNYPEVVMPLPFITTWPEDRFMDSWHFFSFAAKIMSARLGPDIKAMMTDPSYRGIAPDSVQKLDVELDRARHKVERPPGCTDEAPTSPRAPDKDGSYTNCIGLRLVGLPVGHFIMGSCPEGGECPRGAIPDIHAREEETAAHPVSIDRAFQISETPITVAQFQTFLDSPQALADEAATDVLAINQQFLDANQGDRNRPVTFISWDNTRAFVDWLNKIKAPSDEGTYRLPTEAEWEYAARSGSQTGFWWGGEPSLDMANCVGCTERYQGKISPVASFPPNLFGLYDMNGNVWEWMEDCYRGWYVSTATDGRAYEKPECQDRSIRGGGADYPTPYWSRATSRFFNKASSRSPTLGFRIVRDPPPEEISTQWPGPATPITGGKPIASGDNSGSPERAFDGQTDTMWISAERGNQVKGHAWIGYQLANPKAVRWIRIQQPTNPPYRQDMVRVESSSDGISWSPAAESAFQLVGETAWIYLPKAESARFWRLVAAADNATAPEYAWVVVEVGLYPARGDMESDSVSPPRAGPQRAELNQK